MSEFALHGVEQLLTSMHVEFAKICEMRVFTVPSDTYNASQIYGRLRNASVNRKNREAKPYRH